MSAYLPDTTLRQLPRDKDSYVKIVLTALSRSHSGERKKYQVSRIRV